MLHCCWSVLTLCVIANLAVSRPIAKHPKENNLSPSTATDVVIQRFPVDTHKQPFLHVDSFRKTVKSTGRPYIAFVVCASLRDVYLAAHICVAVQAVLQ